VQRNSGTTATTGVFFSQSIESINSIPFMGKTITFSFYARAGANYSSASNALSVKVDTGTGTDQSIINTWTGGASAIGGDKTATLTTTWQRFTYTGTASATGNQLGFYFSYTPVGTAGANDWFEVTGVQIDIGSVALPFRTYAATIQGELSACQRYFYQWTSGQDRESALGFYQTSSAVYFAVPLPVTMRIRPSIIAATGTGIYYALGVGGYDLFNSVTAWQGGTNNMNFNNTTEASGTAGQAAVVLLSFFLARSRGKLHFTAQNFIVHRANMADETESKKWHGIRTASCLPFTRWQPARTSLHSLPRSKCVPRALPLCCKH
jgi:hypothetical protein